MPDLPADPAALRAAMRDDVATELTSTDLADYCPDYYIAEAATCAAEVILARLSDRYDLDGWLAHLAAERAEEEAECTCTHYVVDYSDPERYHPENVDREANPTCPVHAERAEEVRG